MSALQNTLCRKFRKSFSHKMEQPQQGYKNPHAIEACKHFNNWNHVFHEHGKFILIGHLDHIKNTSAEVLKQRLKDRENYWKKRLKTLTLLGLYQELNSVHCMQYFFRSPLFLVSAYASNIWLKYH